MWIGVAITLAQIFKTTNNAMDFPEADADGRDRWRNTSPTNTTSVKLKARVKQFNLRLQAGIGPWVRHDVQTHKTNLFAASNLSTQGLHDIEARQKTMQESRTGLPNGSRARSGRTRTRVTRRQPDASSNTDQTGDASSHQHPPSHYSNSQNKHHHKAYWHQNGVQNNTINTHDCSDFSASNGTTQVMVYLSKWCFCCEARFRTLEPQIRIYPRRAWAEARRDSDMSQIIF